MGTERAQQQRPVRLLLCLTILHALALLLFTRGFLLTRVELPHTSPCAQQCKQRQQYDKAVVLIIDALRHDFVCPTNSSEKQPHEGLFTQTLELLARAEGAATVLRFVADTPTITMSRLKALLTGGLPTFLDIGKSFSASTVTEDNLVAQLRARKRRLVFMGDDTWMQLVPGAFVEAYPYPSFNVKDLHTVDDGVWQHLVPALDRPADWDVLVAHYLGVDHAGHTYGVASQQMTDKVVQMDGQVAHVLHKLAAAAGPGQPYERAVLLVMGDHGQTLGGDHGGGSHHETDSVLVAVSLAKLHAALQPPQHIEQQRQQQRQHAATAFLQSVLARHAGSSSDTGARESGSSSSPQSASHAASQLLCARSIPQVDLTPTLAALLGVAMPYGNIGRLAPELWAVLGGSSSREELLVSYQGALWDNVQQVHTYLNSYAQVASLPVADLQHGNTLFDRAAAAATATEGQAADEAALLQSVLSQLKFLDAAAALARAQFTQFNQPMIWTGCLAAAAMLAHQLLLCRRALYSAHGAWTLESRALAALAALHALCLFSVGALMGEGRLQCWLAAMMGLLVLRAALSACLSARAAATRLAAARHLAAGCTSVDAAPTGQLEALSGKRTMLCDARACITRSSQSIKSDADAAADSPHVTGNGAVEDIPCTIPQTRWSGLRPALMCAWLGFVVLACNAALQAWGLIDRSGQDPHDKSQMEQELLGAAAGGGPWSRQLLSMQAPLLAVVLLLLGADRWLAAGGPSSSGRMQRGLEASRAPGRVRLRSLTRAAAAATAVEYACISAWWLAHRWDAAEASMESIASAWAAAGVGAVGYLGMVLQAVGLDGVVMAVLAPVLGLPLRLLLPRVVYVLALAIISSFMAAAAAATLSSGHLLAAAQRLVSSSAHGGDLQVGREQLVSLARAFLWLSGSCSGAVVMVLGFRGPWVMLMALLQGMGLVGLMAMHATAQESMRQRLPEPRAVGAAARCQNGVCGNGVGDKQHLEQGSFPGATGSAPGSMFSNGVGSGMWAMYALQLFFCSGHFCEFTGLQYSSSFIGFDDVVWVASGALLLLNTFGFLLLGCLSLPAVVAIGLLCRPDHAPCTQQALGIISQFATAMAGAVLVSNTMRFAGLGVSIVSAAIQQRHILLWAIFAPKLVFEAFFMAIMDVSQLLVAWLACSLLLPKQ